MASLFPLARQGQEHGWRLDPYFLGKIRTEVRAIFPDSSLSIEDIEQILIALEPFLTRREVVPRPKE